MLIILVMSQCSIFILTMSVIAVHLHTKHRALSRAGLYQVLHRQNHGDNELVVEDIMEPKVGNILPVKERHGWGTFKGKRKKQNKRKNKRRKQRKKTQKKKQQKRSKKKKKKQKQKNGRKKSNKKASYQPKIDRSCNCGISKDLIQVCISASFTFSLYLNFPCRE
jgi:hypothetical protein